MKILRNILILFMMVLASVYWIKAQPKQKIDINALISEQEKPEHAIHFTAQNSKGVFISLNHFKGKPIILNFWATWCPPCVEELPELLQYAEWAKKNLGLEVVAVSVDESWSKIDDMFKKKKLWPNKELPITILLDTAAEVPKKYGTSKFPESFFIDQQFKVVRKFVGPQRWASQEMMKWTIEVLNQQ
jgi:cytochrome c biogenesis protein CcmG, thiol:disulfide interchange protein DsbE